MRRFHPIFQEHRVKLGLIAIAILVIATTLVFLTTAFPLSRSGRLIAHLRNDDDEARHAADELGEIGPSAIPELLPLLSSSDASRRYWACAAIGNMRSRGSEGVPALIAALSDGDDDVKAGAVSALQKIGISALPAVPELIRLAAQTNNYLRLNAGVALWRISHEPEPALHILTNVVWVIEPYYQDRVIRVLSEMESEGLGAVPTLEAFRSVKNSRLRFAALRARWRITANGSNLVDDLSGFVTNKDDRYQELALELLGEIGPPASQSTQAVRIALQSGDLRIRRTARKALLQIEGSKE